MPMLQNQQWRWNRMERTSGSVKKDSTELSLLLQSDSCRRTLKNSAWSNLSRYSKQLRLERPEAFRTVLNHRPLYLMEFWAENSSLQVSGPYLIVTLERLQI